MAATINRQAKAMNAMPPGLGPPIFTLSRIDSAKGEMWFGFEYECKCEMMTEGADRAFVDPTVARMTGDIRVVMSFMVILGCFFPFL